MTKVNYKAIFLSNSINIMKICNRLNSTSCPSRWWRVFKLKEGSGVFPKGTQCLRTAPSDGLIYSGAPWLMVTRPSSAKRGFVSTWKGMLWDISCCLDWPSNKVLASTLLPVEIFVLLAEGCGLIVLENLGESGLCAWARTFIPSAQKIRSVSWSQIFDFWLYQLMKFSKSLNRIGLGAKFLKERSRGLVLKV